MSHFRIERITLELPLSKLPTWKIAVAALGEASNTLSNEMAKIVHDSSEHTTEIIVQNATLNAIEVEANSQVSRFMNQSKLASISSPASL